MILRRLDAVITDSVAIGAELKLREQDPPVVAIRNGIDTAWFDPTCSLAPSSVTGFAADGDYVFGMVGRIHPVKGHLNFLKAARTILDRYPRSRFVIVGTVLPGLNHIGKRLSIGSPSMVWVRPFSWRMSPWRRSPPCLRLWMYW